MQLFTQIQSHRGTGKFIFSFNMNLPCRSSPRSRSRIRPPSGRSAPWSDLNHVLKQISGPRNMVQIWIYSIFILEAQIQNQNSSRLVEEIFVFFKALFKPVLYCSVCPFLYAAASGRISNLVSGRIFCLTVKQYDLKMNFKVPTKNI